MRSSARPVGTHLAGLMRTEAKARMVRPTDQGTDTAVLEETAGVPRISKLKRWSKDLAPPSPFPRDRAEARYCVSPHGPEADECRPGQTVSMTSTR